MLAGRYAGSRVRDLKPRIVFDRIEQHVARGQRRGVRALQLGRHDSRSRLLPPAAHRHERVDRRTRRRVRLGGDRRADVRVRQSGLADQSHHAQRRARRRRPKSGTTATPFWLAEGYDRSFHYSDRIGEFLERTEARLERRRPRRHSPPISTRRGFDAPATDELIGYLDRQREHTGAPLPHRHHVLVEHIKPGRAATKVRTKSRSCCTPVGAAA